MRKAFNVFGWVVLFLIMPLFLVVAWYINDVPAPLPWVATGVTATILVYFTRNRDDVLKHHLV